MAMIPTSTLEMLCNEADDLRKEIIYYRNECEKYRIRLHQIRVLVNEQAEDEGLWAVPAEGEQRIAEAILQKALRDLHRVIEG